MKNWLQKYYLRIRIILTFLIVTFILVLIMSRVSYYYSRSIYLDQLSNHAKMMTSLLAKQIDPAYLELLQLGKPGTGVLDYFQSFAKTYDSELEQSDFFVFDNSLKILMHSSQPQLIGQAEPRLLLNQKEIFELQPYTTNVTLPFLGADNNWYLWSFLRFDEDVWFGLQVSAIQLERIEELSNLFWTIGFGGIFLTTILGFFMARSITKPLEQLRVFSSAIGRGDFSSSLPDKIKGELKILAEAMDRMRHDIVKSHKEKEEILAQIAHEIRNPLGSIELMANLTKEDLLSGKKDIKYLNNILHEISGLKSLITNYLNYSRPYLAKQQNVDLNQLTDEIYALFKETFDKKGIHFEQRIKLETLWFDPGHLKQILINLVANSIESINENGKIIIETLEDNQIDTIRITDNGPGINQEKLVTIFGPFFTTKKNGTGLGLSICKKLCEQNNAQIQAFNNPEQGCLFEISKRKENDE